MKVARVWMMWKTLMQKLLIPESPQWSHQLLENKAATLPNLMMRMNPLSSMILIATPPLSLIAKTSFVVIHQDVILQ